MKKKSQAYYLCVAFSVFFLMALACFIKYINNLNISIVFGVGSLIMFACLMASIIHCIMHCQGISVKFCDQASLISEKKGKEIFAFFGYLSSPDQLFKISGNNITEFRLDSGTMVYNSTGEGEQDCKFDVVETCGLLPNKKFKLQVNSSLDYKMIFDVSDFSKLQSPGFCIFVQPNGNTVKIKEKMEKLRDFYIRSPKIENGILYINYGYKKFLESIEDARLILSKRVGIQSDGSVSQNVVTLYDLLLQKVFRSCPSDEEDIYPINRDGDPAFMSSDRRRDFWINQPDGRMALFLLSNFSLYSIAGRGSVCLSNARRLDDLNKKICCIQRYIARNGKLQDTSCLSDLFEKLRGIICDEEKIAYCSLHKNYLLNGGRYLSEAICEDLEDDLDRYIYAIASYQDYMGVAQSCNFIKNLLCSSGHENLVDQAKSLLDGNLYEAIKYNAPCYESMKVFQIVNELFSGSRMWYSGKELINAARQYIVRKYIPNQLGLFDEKFSTLAIGHVDQIIFIDGKQEIQVKSNISVDEVISNNASGVMP